MTGFARAEGAGRGVSWTWEIRSVNGRTLDLRLRLPPGMERLDPRVRAALGERIRRGSVNATLTVIRASGAPPVRVNREALDRMVALAAELQDAIEAAPPRIDGLLALRGVLEEVAEEENENDRTALDDAIVASFVDALGRLAAVRAEEGERLARAVAGHLDEIARLAAEAQRAAAAQPAAIESRLKEQVRMVLEDQPSLPAERLAQEVALLVVKADVREEIDRLVAHVAQARDIMAGEGAVGRRLDFLCQELNREANTLCSKAADIELTRIGLDLKTAVDQLREQIQNLE